MVVHTCPPSPWWVVAGGSEFDSILSSRPAGDVRVCLRNKTQTRRRQAAGEPGGLLPPQTRMFSEDSIAEKRRHQLEASPRGSVFESATIWTSGVIMVVTPLRRKPEICAHIHRIQTCQRKQGNGDGVPPSQMPTNSERGHGRPSIHSSPALELTK